MFSKQRESKEKEMDPEFGGKIMFWESDPIYIVSFYKIEKIEVRKDKASAIIKYRSLAHTEGRGYQNRCLKPDLVTDDISKIELVKAKGRWWIIDPPIPRISRQAILEYYNSIIEGMSEWINDKDTSKSQKRGYDKALKTIKVIKNLPSE